MRRILFIIALLVISNSLFAQKDVTKFMGIPVDGFKPEMIQKLKEKGFVSSASDKNILEGEFNGAQVNVHVVTNNNKVYRIMLCDAHQMEETDIRIRFNNLCQQFKNNSNYVSFGDYEIADDEDIAYELTVHDKRYEAIFYQKPLAIDTTEIANIVKESVLSKYTQQELDDPTEEIKKDIAKISIDYLKEIIPKKSGKLNLKKYNILYIYILQRNKMQIVTNS